MSVLKYSSAPSLTRSTKYCNALGLPPGGATYHSLFSCTYCWALNSGGFSRRDNGDRLDTVGITSSTAASGGIGITALAPPSIGVDTRVTDLVGIAEALVGPEHDGVGAVVVQALHVLPRGPSQHLTTPRARETTKIFTLSIGVCVQATSHINTQEERMYSTRQPT